MGPLGWVLAAAEAGRAPGPKSGVRSYQSGNPQPSASGFLQGHESEGDLLSPLPFAGELLV